MKTRSRCTPGATTPTPIPPAKKLALLIGLLLLTCGIIWATPLLAQTPPASPNFTLPPSRPAPIVAPPDAGNYILEFNRSPIVGNRLRLEGIYNEARLRFTRPQNWKPQTVKVLLRFRHSPALYASRSNLTVLINGTSIGSVPLKTPEGKVTSVTFDAPPNLIRDYNELVIAGLQNNSPTCTQDPFDPSLWTEILPDSKIVFGFQPQPIPLDFSRYPYPIFDTLSLESNQLAYLLPQAIDESWLTAASRFQTSIGRIAAYRSLETRVVKAADAVKPNEKLVVIGTPANQPSIATLNLPLSLKDGKFLDGKQQPFPPNVGILMLTTTANKRAPVLIATGNGAEGVTKAVQFLVQFRDRQISTGHMILVNQLTNVASPPAREWQGYLPLKDSFQIKELQTQSGQTFDDVTVWGSHAPAFEFDFRALPDDRFLAGNAMTLRYSYGPQVNPLTSLVEVALDGVSLAGQRLSSINGGSKEAFTFNLPEAGIKPNSKIQVNFRLDPRERRSCSRVTDQQLWGTVHTDTSFDLKRENLARLPSLKLFQFGFPFAAPQDLSTTAIVLPDKPSPDDLQLMLTLSQRLGQGSRAESVKLDAYRVSRLSPADRQSHHLIGIGTQKEFPFPEAFATKGFALGELSSRQWQQSQIQTLPDDEGLVKEVVSPWNRDRVLLALSSQTPAGLTQVQNLIAHDALFSQLQGDTVLVSPNTTNPDPYNPNDYRLEFLQEAPQIELTGTAKWNLLRLLRNNWFLLAPAILAAAIVLYGVSQLYLKRIVAGEK